MIQYFTLLLCGVAIAFFYHGIGWRGGYKAGYLAASEDAPDSEEKSEEK